MAKTLDTSLDTSAYRAEVEKKGTCHVALYYKEGSSDKEYHVHLTAKGTKYNVAIEYGRRGSSLTSASKTPVPVDLDAALIIFAKQVHAKRLKGYTEGEGQTPYVGGDKEQKITGVLPQLLNNIDEEDLDDYFDSGDWCMQEKKDGKRFLLRRQAGVLEAINRKGLLVGFPQAIQDRLMGIKSDFVLDGELIGEVLWIFDILEYGNKDVRNQSYDERHTLLIEVLIGLDADGSAIQIVPTVFSPVKKRKVFEAIKEKRGEGVVFKRLSAPYKVGRPNSGGDQLKFKFKATATCQVSGHNEKGKRSVHIQALDGKVLVDVGKVTVLPNFNMPNVGALVEIEYLYRHVHGALYQPVYLGERDDLDKPDQVNTLKVKEGIDEEEA